MVGYPGDGPARADAADEIARTRHAARVQAMRGMSLIASSGLSRINRYYVGLLTIASNCALDLIRARWGKSPIQIIRMLL
jgi:hypothetical protein